MNKTLKYLLVSTTLLLSAAALASCDLFDKRTRIKVRLNGLNTLINDYATEFNKTSKDFKVIVEQSAGYGGVKKDNNAEFATGKQPNITVGYPDHFEEYNSIGDRVVNLETYMNDPEIGFTKEQLADFKQGYLDEGKQYSKKGTYSLPFSKSVEVTYYNKKFFDAHNLTMSEKPTWDDFEKLGTQIRTFKEADLKAAKLSDKEVQEKMKTFYPIGYDSDDNLLIRSVVAHGGKYTEFNKDTKEAKLSFVDEKDPKEIEITKEVTRYLAGLNKKQILNTKKGNGGNYLSSTYINGDLMVTVGSSAGIKHNVFKDPSKGFNGLTLAPEFKDKKRTTISQGPSIGILKSSNEEANRAAWKFLKTLYNADFQFENNILRGYDSVLKSTAQLPKYKEWVASKSVTNEEKLLKEVAQLYNKIPETELYLSPVFSKSAKARELAGTIVHGLYSNEDYKKIKTEELESKKAEIDKIIDTVIKAQNAKLFA